MSNPSSEEAWKEQVEVEIGILHNEVNAIEARVAKGVVVGIKQVLSDEELVKKFWETGYQQLAKQASDKGSQWIGKRIFTLFVGAVVTAGLIWLAKSGALK